MPGTPKIRMKRVYEAAHAEDGMRVLVDRLWPRGIAKTKLEFDLWARDVAPSNALRQWYHRDPEQFEEFRARYRAELAGNRGAVEELKAVIGSRRATLLTAAKDPARSHVVVLREELKKPR